ncbi:polyphosphate polymerase domain-containing protein [Aestuariimicrobium ganziense]|uniref:polyphosphate polymerase domain-containing protein n=1 Tax=Aestuariimicrobium ganziense TaxID=2773677 RepID=UPI001943375E|nr:polyphosphate polymerase domain-containing protein [Aestuariimicrobium ganziense]
MSALDRLRPVSLAELTERAALMSRTDRKYLVPSSLLDQVVATLAGSHHDGLQILQIGTQRQFGYRSTYLDTPELDFYRCAATGRRRRPKVRLRTYLDSGEAYVEVKTREARGTAVKERLLRQAGTAGDRVGLTAEELDFVAGRLAARTGDCLALHGLHPVLVTAYRRTTLLVPDEAARVTLDTGLSWSLPQGVRAGAPAVLDDLVVIETKSGSRPGRADRALWAAGIRPVRLSKYATGMALTHGLKANRWHRTTSLLRADLNPPHPSTKSLALAG